MKMTMRNKMAGSMPQLWRLQDPRVPYLNNVGYANAQSGECLAPMVRSKLGQCDVQLRQRSCLRGIPDPLLVLGYQPMPGFDATKAYGSQFLEYPLQSL